MKKLISLILSIVIACTFFYGCYLPGSESPTLPPEPTNYPPPSNWPIEFKLYDGNDASARWTFATAELLEWKFDLKVSNVIPAVEQKDMSTKAGRDLYISQISLLFEDEAAVPDFMPALKGSPASDDGVWKIIGEKYLVDFNPYIAEGQLLECYVDYVWGAEYTDLGIHNDARAYWENTKAALEYEDKLYVLPRRNMFPINEFLGYNVNMLEALDMGIEDTPSTWEDFEKLLETSKTLFTNDFVPLVAENGSAENIIRLVASTYGLTFDEDYTWLQKNGEPFWAYAWDEYLEVLKTVRSLAEKGYVLTDNVRGKNVLLNYDFDPESEGYKAKAEFAQEAYTEGKALVGFNSLDSFMEYSEGGKADWQIANTHISQDGYTYALRGTALFDDGTQNGYTGGYIAINKRNWELTLRLMDYLGASFNDEGYMAFHFGREGSVFTDAFEAAGSYIYDENGKIHLWTNTPWGLENEREFFKTYDERTNYFDDYNELPIPENAEPTKNYAELYGIEGTGYWPVTDEMKTGVNAFSAPYPIQMQLTAYWDKNGEYDVYGKLKNSLSAAEKVTDADGVVHIYDGMFFDPFRRLGSVTGQTQLEKINAINALAKEFTIGFLSGEMTEDDWENYLNRLKQANYEDVYKYYRTECYAYNDRYDESVSSQSDANRELQIIG